MGSSYPSGDNFTRIQKKVIKVAKDLNSGPKRQVTRVVPKTQITEQTIELFFCFLLFSHSFLCILATPIEIKLLT